MSGLELILKAKEERIRFYGRLLDNDKVFFETLEKELKALEIIANADTSTLLHYLATVVVDEKDWLLCEETIKKYKREE